MAEVLLDAPAADVEVRVDREVVTLLAAIGDDDGSEWTGRLGALARAAADAGAAGAWYVYDDASWCCRPAYVIASGRQT